MSLFTHVFPLEPASEFNVINHFAFKVVMQ